MLRTPRFFDERRPDLLPVRVPIRSSAIGSSLGEVRGLPYYLYHALPELGLAYPQPQVPIPEVLDVGIRALNLRLRLPQQSATTTSSPATPTDVNADEGASRTGGDGARVEGAFTPRARALYDDLLVGGSAEAKGGRSLAELLCELSVRPSSAESSDGHLGDEALDTSDKSTICSDLSDGSSTKKNQLLVQLPGVVQWHAEFVRHVLPLRLSLEHLWSGNGKTHIIKRCCELDLLQVGRPRISLNLSLALSTTSRPRITSAPPSCHPGDAPAERVAWPGS